MNPLKNHTTSFTALGIALLVFVSWSASAQDSLRIVVLGSSTAAGSGASTYDSAWVGRYSGYINQAYPGSEVINLSRGGYTSYQLQPDFFSPPIGRPAPDSQRNISQALRLRPTVIIVNLPSNDAARNYDSTEQIENFERIAALADFSSVPIWVTTTQPRNFSFSQRENLIWFRGWSKMRFGAYSLDFWSAIAATDGTINPLFNSGDGIHLNDGGHRVLYEQVVAAMIPETLTSVPYYASEATDLQYTLFPNPFESYLNLVVQANPTSNVEIVLSDLLGRSMKKMHSGKITAGYESLRFGLNSLRPGIYVLTVRSGNTVRTSMVAKR
ncbi:MAG: hypothetical protein CL946_07315 [Ectothiorhodospiraceae bacterium]|nr:hypothetical protein [Ectothiorhodospiraceae bacterium]